MLTDGCNLDCPYCFAHEFVVKSRPKYQITMEQFRRILDFILLDGTDRHVGLIGGEPSIHPLFGEFLDVIEDEPRIDYVVIYTNGIALKKHIERLLSEKIRMLINCNSPEIVGEARFFQLTDNINQLAEKNAHVTLGINVYKPDYDVSFLLPLLELFERPRLRFSLSMPKFPDSVANPLESFRLMKKTMLDIFCQMKDRNIIPYFDCNFFPPCLFTAEETATFDDWGAENPLLTMKSRAVSCAPVIDIMADGTAVRCFGLSAQTKVNIRDFATITDLRRYYMRTVDAYAMNCYYDSSCRDCYKFRTAKCTAGCLAYKMKRVGQLRKAVEKSIDGNFGL